MSRTVQRALVFPVLMLLSTHLSSQGAQGGGTKVPKADEAAAQAARDVLAKFDKDDPGWKTRMTGLVALAKAGPGVRPSLIEALKNGAPAAREFAAQALLLFADASARPALEQALEDAESGVRIHAIHALSMLGPLPRTERHEQMRKSDPCRWGVRPMMIAALERDDRPDPAALRKAFAEYDLGVMASARIGEAAPDFTLKDFTGKTRRLSEFRGKKQVVLRFILFDF